MNTWHKIISFLRRAEVLLLRFATFIGRWFVRIGHRIVVALRPRIREYLKILGLAIIILYVIGAVVFGIRLYGQNKFESSDRIASYIYPFPVATVGRGVVLDHELQIKVAWARTFAKKTQNEIPPDLPRGILDEIAKDKISMQEADKAGIKVTDTDISATFDRVFEGMDGEDQTAEYVKSFYGMTLDQLRAEAVPKIALQKLRELEFVRIKARLILVKDDKRAKEALDKVRGGSKFEDIAKDYSEDQGSKDQGGMLADGEYIYRDSGVISELEGPLFSLKAGEVSDVIKTNLGNAVLKIEEHSGTIDQKTDDWFIELMKKDYPVRAWI